MELPIEDQCVIYFIILPCVHFFYLLFPEFLLFAKGNEHKVNRDAQSPAVCPLQKLDVRYELFGHSESGHCKHLYQESEIACLLLNCFSSVTILRGSNLLWHFAEYSK